MFLLYLLIYVVPPQILAALFLLFYSFYVCFIIDSFI